MPPATRVASIAPRDASRVLPMAMVIEVTTVMARDVPAGLWVVRLTRKAPSITAGHNRYPQSRIAASARPVGGQTAEALVFNRANERPSLPAAK